MAEALSLAAAIFQFVDYARKATIWSKEIYDSIDGATKHNTEIEQFTLEVESCFAGLLQEERKEFMTEDGQAIKELSSQAIVLAGQLQQMLQKLKAGNVSVAGRRRFPEILSKTVGTMLKKSEIEEIDIRIQSLLKQVSLRLLKLIANGQMSAIHKIEALNESCISIQSDTKAILQQLQLNRMREPQGIGADRKLQPIVSGLPGAIEKLAYHEMVLQKLHFPSMEYRDFQLKECYQGTSNWIYKDDRCHNFMDWLAYDGGIFWISGKAGSGKSMLMKHLLSQEETQAALEKWASNSLLAIAKHYFWISGEPLQRSINGLYRSLLHQILVQAPDLISVIFPSIHDRSFDTGHLEKALQALTNVTGSPALRICLFIDGLDEFREDGETDCDIRIVRVVEHLAKSPNVKLCVSSRPWSAFTGAFERSTSGSNERRQARTLRVQDFTEADMKLFAEKSIMNANKKVTRGDQRWCELGVEIAKRSEGVWLWARLVVNVIANGVARNESYQSVVRLLDSYPNSLDGLYERIMKTIHDEGHGAMSVKILLLSLVAKSPLYAADICYFLLEGFDPINAALGRLESDKSLSLNLPIPSLNDIRDRLHNRCKDFLEIVSSPYIRRFHSSLTSTPFMEFEEDSMLRYARVGFIHRTVCDFLKTKYESKLRIQAGREFCPQITTMAMILVNLRTKCRLIESPLSLSRRNGDELWNFLQELDPSRTRTVNYLPTFYDYFAVHFFEFFDFASELDTTFREDFRSFHTRDIGLVSHGKYRQIKRLDKYHQYDRDTATGRKFETYVKLVSCMSKLTLKWQHKGIMGEILDVNTTHGRYHWMRTCERACGPAERWRLNRCNMLGVTFVVDDQWLPSKASGHYDTDHPDTIPEGYLSQLWGASSGPVGREIGVDFAIRCRLLLYIAASFGEQSFLEGFRAETSSSNGQLYNPCRLLTLLALAPVNILYYWGQCRQVGIQKQELSFGFDAQLVEFLVDFFQSTLDFTLMAPLSKHFNTNGLPIEWNDGPTIKGVIENRRTITFWDSYLHFLGYIEDFRLELMNSKVDGKLIWLRASSESNGINVNDYYESARETLDVLLRSGADRAKFSKAVAEISHQQSPKYNRRLAKVMKDLESKYPNDWIYWAKSGGRNVITALGQLLPASVLPRSSDEVHMHMAWAMVTVMAVSLLIKLY